MYKQYQQNQQTIKIEPPNSYFNKPKLTFTAIKPVAPSSNFITTSNGLTSNLNRINANTTTLKRPFIMFAILFVFGINIFQFVQVFNLKKEKKKNSILI